MFQNSKEENGDSKNSFPKAMTMLEATSEANNRNAYDMSRSEYVKNMEKIVGISCPYMKEPLLMVCLLGSRLFCCCMVCVLFVLHVSLGSCFSYISLTTHPACVLYMICVSL